MEMVGDGLTEVWTALVREGEKERGERKSGCGRGKGIGGEGQEARCRHLYKMAAESIENVLCLTTGTAAVRPHAAWWGSKTCPWPPPV